MDTFTVVRPMPSLLLVTENFSPLKVRVSRLVISTPLLGHVVLACTFTVPGLCREICGRSDLPSHFTPKLNRFSKGTSFKISSGKGGGSAIEAVLEEMARSMDIVAK